MELRFRATLPVAYLAISVVLFLLCLLHLAPLTGAVIFRINVSCFAYAADSPVSCRFRQGSEYAGMLDTIVLVLLPYSLTVAQYFFLGRLIDFLLGSRTVPPKQKQ